mmetsp:Transcript_2297/g.6284  ORF Transcript_2297/g.6284 Transcript_2297/m.6284 type:complete len:266 (+) Transcript_2297:820-1617(+)
MCATVGSMRIPNVEFAKSIKLQGAQGFSVKMDKMVVTDLPANVPAGKALIKLSAQVYNPSSFVLDGLDVMSLDVYTDDSWPFTEKPAADSLGVKFVEAFTEPGFWLGRGHSEWFDIEGFLSVPEREYDLVKMADVLNHFLTSRPTPLIACVRHRHRTTTHGWHPRPAPVLPRVRADNIRHAACTLVMLPARHNPSSTPPPRARHSALSCPACRRVITTSCNTYISTSTFRPPSQPCSIRSTAPACTNTARWSSRIRSTRRSMFLA